MLPPVVRGADWKGEFRRVLKRAWPAEGMTDEVLVVVPSRHRHTTCGSAMSSLAVRAALDLLVHAFFLTPATGHDRVLLVEAEPSALDEAALEKMDLHVAQTEARVLAGERFLTPPGQG